MGKIDHKFFHSHPVDHAFVVHLDFICLFVCRFLVVAVVVVVVLFRYFSFPIFLVTCTPQVHGTHIELLTGVSSRLYTSFSH